MGKKAIKSARKFAASGQLQKTIQARKKHQEARRKIQGRQKQKAAKDRRATELDDHEKDEDAPVEETSGRNAKSSRKNKLVFISAVLISL